MRKYPNHVCRDVQCQETVWYNLAQDSVTGRDSACIYTNSQRVLRNSDFCWDFVFKHGDIIRTIDTREEPRTGRGGGEGDGVTVSINPDSNFLYGLDYFGDFPADHPFISKNKEK